MFKKLQSRGIEITQVQDAAHLEKVIPLFDQYRQFYGQTSDLKGAHHFLHERQEKPIKESEIIFAYLDGTAVGFTQLYPSFSSVAMKRLWILNDLFVTKSARGKGVGLLLLEAARLYASSTGAVGLMLETADSNREAQKLYEKAGWQKNSEYYYHLNLI